MKHILLRHYLEWIYPWLFCYHVLGFWSRQVTVDQQKCGPNVCTKMWRGVVWWCREKSPILRDHNSAIILNSWSFCSLQKACVHSLVWCSSHSAIPLSIRCKTPSQYTTVCATRQCTLLTLCQEWWWTHALSQLVHELWTCQQDMPNLYKERKSTDLSGSLLWFFTVGLCHRPLDALF